MEKLQLAKIIWDYHKVNIPLEKADCIIVLGSHDTRVAERGAELFLGRWAPLLVFSGYLGAFTHGIWERPEAEIFAEVAENMGVPRDKIIIEDKSTNTGENVDYTRDLLSEKGIHPNRIIAVQKPYMERRTYATFKKRWPEPWLTVTSPQMGIEEYLSIYENKDEIIDIMVGDLHRIMLYPALGYQIYQEVPHRVVEAFNELVRLGFTSRLVKI